jgi:hypothetical protein
VGPEIDVGVQPALDGSRYVGAITLGVPSGIPKGIEAMAMALGAGQLTSSPEGPTAAVKTLSTAAPPSMRANANVCALGWTRLPSGLT